MHTDDDELIAIAKLLETTEEQADEARAAGDPEHDATLEAVRRTILECLAADPKTDDPVNALVVWTELGRALSGTLDEVGAGRGYIKKLSSAWFEERRATPDVKLDKWIYRLDEQRRLGPDEIKRASLRVDEALAQALPELARASSESPGGRQALFLAVVKGWFPVGLELFRALPAGQTAQEADVLGALWAWCLRYLPDDSPDGSGSLLTADSALREPN